MNNQLSDTFQLICKIGKGSYGSVYKALDKEKSQLVAMKKIPIDSDLMDIIKEISMMQQCDSEFIVKYLGSYFKDSDLWIVMEYCDYGSVSDIMKLLGKSLSENEISIILGHTLKGLEYIHLKKKIHRDIKACNILLNVNGLAKLADFGVAGQLSDSLTKRNTVIGTPYWMAPEVIQEVGYDCSADIWSLGITCIEMFECKPPYSEIHPMRAIFMIPTKPPPTFKDVTKCSRQFRDFVRRCLIKNPSDRANASGLLQDEFLKSNNEINIKLDNLIERVKVVREENQINFANTGSPTIYSTNSSSSSSTASNQTSSTSSSIFFKEPTGSPEEFRTLVEKTINSNLLDFETIKNNEANNTLNKPKEYAIQDEDDEDSQNDTMIVNDHNASGSMDDPFLTAKTSNEETTDEALPELNQVKNMIRKEIKYYDHDKSFLYELSQSDIILRLKYLDQQMEQEIEDMKNKYAKKRATIEQAIEFKKKNSVIF